MASEYIKRFPLAKVLQIKELKGWAGKSLIVPPGRIGIRIDDRGQVKIFPEGTYPVLSFFERLTGRATKMRFGYLLNQAFINRIDSGYLLSGDGELMDISMVVSASIGDPGAYFKEQVIPLGEIDEIGVRLSDKDLQAALGPLVHQYTSEDLYVNIPTDRLAVELMPRLDAILKTQGLKLDQILLLAFWPVEIREKITLQEKMIKLDAQTQFEDYQKQFEEEGGPQVSFRPVQNKTGNMFSTFETIKAWISGNKTKSVENSNLLKMLQDKNKAPTNQEKAHRPAKNWWVGRSVGIIILIIFGMILTLIIQHFGEGVSPERVFGFITTGVWGAIVLAILDNIRKLIQKHEDIVDETRTYLEKAHLEELVNNRRPELDKLVRQQCSMELERTREIFNTMRSKVYKEGDTETALLIRDLERKIDVGCAKLTNPDFGTAAYLKDLHISNDLWMEMVEYDEDLLSYAGGLSEKALLIQQNEVAKDETKPVLLEVEKHLNTFIHHFGTRTRLLQTKN